MIFPKKIIQWAEKKISNRRYFGRWNRIKISPCKKFILKEVRVIVGFQPNKSVPTLQLEDGRYFLQPNVDRKQRYKAYSLLKKSNSPEEVGEDCHLGNCGMWRGRAVVFDW